MTDAERCPYCRSRRIQFRWRKPQWWRWRCERCGKDWNQRAPTEQDIVKMIRKERRERPPLNRAGQACKPNGRHSTLGPEVTAILVRLLRDGNYLDTACDVAGVAVRTVQEWMYRGELEERQGFPEGPHARFARTLKTAMGEAQSSALALVRRRVHNWQALAWFLERRTPQKFAQRQRLEHTGAEGGPIRSQQEVTLGQLRQLPSEELEQLQTLLQKVESVTETVQ